MEQLSLRPIDRGNYNACIALRVAGAQENFVAPNIVSLVQAAYEPDMYPLGIYRAQQMVGFILYDFDPALPGWSMSRFMIGEAFQNQGIGRPALQLFLSYFTAKHGRLPLYTSVEVDNPVAALLYEKAGFKRLDTFEYEVDGRHFTETRMVIQP